MYQTIIIDYEHSHARKLAAKINDHYPTLDLKIISDKQEDYRTFLHDTSSEIVFLDPGIIQKNGGQCLRHPDVKKAIICVTDNLDLICKPPFWKSIAFLLKPIKTEHLVSAIEVAIKYIRGLKDRENKEKLIQDILQGKKNDRLIGIPTIEGFEVINVDNIIHCEGLQKCTRIVTSNKTNIVSSYNIGVYKKKLEEYSEFFFPHRSHIVNLLHVRKFKKSGSIILNNGSHVPISKNNRDDFLQKINRV